MKQIKKEFTTPECLIMTADQCDVLTFSFLAFLGEEDILTTEQRKVVVKSE